MAKRDSFLLRIDPRVLKAIRKWSADDMRSMNGQIEYLLRQSLSRAGRLPESQDSAEHSTGEGGEGSDAPEN